MFNIVQQVLAHTWRFRHRLMRTRLLHRDERGLEALQTVMILAIAGVCLLAIKHWWPWWRDFLTLAIEIYVE